MSPKPILRGLRRAAFIAVILLVLPASSVAKHTNKPHGANNELARKRSRPFVAGPCGHCLP